MTASSRIHLPARKKPARRRCLSCGTTANMARRRYCSVDCRQRLLAALNRRSGLLKALNIRYATFYFSDSTVVMDVLPHGEDTIYSFMLPRSVKRLPVEDFCALSEVLGRAWWAEQGRTKKRYRASQHVLALATPADADSHGVIPYESAIPSVRGAAMMSLKFDHQAGDNDPAALERRIKTAYREQVKRHHPDLGGKPATFRKIQEAYEKLIDWARNPSFVHRSGFPDKWFYDGYAQRWVQPKPALRQTVNP
jgi:hypothetical protein